MIFKAVENSAAILNEGKFYYDILFYGNGEQSLCGKAV